MTPVVGAVLVAEGFALEADASVGAVGVEAADAQADEELDDVPEVESDECHLPLLEGVDELMVELVGEHPSPASLHEDDAEKVEPMVGAKGDETVVDDTHGRWVVVSAREPPSCAPCASYYEHPACNISRTHVLLFPRGWAF